MFLICILDVFAFPYEKHRNRGPEPRKQGQRQSQRGCSSFWKALGDAFNIVDLVAEIWKYSKWFCVRYIFCNKRYRSPEPLLDIYKGMTAHGSNVEGGDARALLLKGVHNPHNRPPSRRPGPV